MLHSFEALRVSAAAEGSLHWRQTSQLALSFPLGRKYLGTEEAGLAATMRYSCL